MRILFAFFALLTVALIAPAEAPMNTQSSAFAKRTFEGKDGGVLNYRLLEPFGYDAAAKTEYPLVIFLHGAGERGNDNEAQLLHVAREFETPENRTKYRCFVMAPQCPARDSWVRVDWSAAHHKLPASMSAPLALTVAAWDGLEKEFHIDQHRVYVVGLSMGGYGTWDLLARFPNRIAAAIPICGGGDEETADKFAKVPIWVFHGALDNAVKPERSRNMVAALHKAGGLPGYTEYPDTGHDSWTRTSRDDQVLKWLFSKTKK